ncbi:MAG: hypothetical protein FJX16_06905 [Alphaproteobacteria bacterium]|nr:hypothetical protein [Alphaproteobacteria bacterium]MBM3625034.1 hypothetical protein [Alphaproteobacteria bacterium]
MSGARDMRILALWRDDPREAPMTIDARIEETRIVSTWELFGAFGLDGDGARPFVLRRDGRIDFGRGESWRTELREATIRVGSEFAVWFNERDSGVYRIVKIAALGAKDDK